MPFWKSVVGLFSFSYYRDIYTHKVTIPRTLSDCDYENDSHQK